MSPVRPLCRCGQTASLHRYDKKLRFECGFCNRKSRYFKSLKEAREDWVAKRGRLKWY